MSTPYIWWANAHLQVIKVAQNQEYVFRHGWFAVRNLSTGEKKAGTTIAQRHAKEAEFFKQAPWSELSKDRVGVPALKTYLAQLLYDHIRNEFPQLVNDIRTKVIETQKQVNTFGESRKTPSEQRSFLTRLANQYQNSNTEASKGNYAATLKAKDPRKLRMHIALENEKFAAKVHAKGHTYTFKSVEDVDAKEVKVNGDTGVKVEPGKSEKPNGNGDKAADSDIENDDGADEKDQIKDIYDWIRINYRNSRGAELPGTVNPAVLESLFRQQAASWGPIAKDYLEVVNKLVSRHIKYSCQDVISDMSIRNKIDERNKRAINQTRELAIAELNQILEDEFGGILQTTNDYFSKSLDDNRRDRLVLRMKKYLASMETTDANGKVVHVGLNPEDLIRQTHLSNEDSAVYGVHDIIKAYYKVAIKRFVDTVVLQVAERHFMGPNGPLKYFSPAFVGELADEDLRHIAGESRSTTMERERLVTLLNQLERALKLGEDEQ